MFHVRWLLTSSLALGRPPYVSTGLLSQEAIFCWDFESPEINWCHVLQCPELSLDRLAAVRLIRNDFNSGGLREGPWNDALTLQALSILGGEEAWKEMAVMENLVRLGPNWTHALPSIEGVCLPLYLAYRLIWSASRPLEERRSAELHSEEDLQLLLEWPWLTLWDTGWLPLLVGAWQTLSLGSMRSLSDTSTITSSFLETLWHYVVRWQDVPLTPVMLFLQTAQDTPPSTQRVLGLACAQLALGLHSRKDLDRRNAVSLAHLTLYQSRRRIANFSEVLAWPLPILLSQLLSKMDAYPDIFRLENNYITSDVHEDTSFREVISAIGKLNANLIRRWSSDFGDLLPDFERHSVWSDVMYRPSKADFVLASVQELRRGTSVVERVCEVGFHSGASAVGWLELFPNAELVVFDLGHPTFNLSAMAADFILAEYPGRVQLHWGDSADTLPAFVARNQDVRCDLVFLDGCKDEVCRRSDFQNVRQISHAATLMLIDDVDPDAADSATAEALRDWVAGGLLSDLVCTKPFQYDVRWHFEGAFGYAQRSNGFCRGYVVPA